MTDIRKIFKEAAIQIGSGGSAGFVEVCIMHPLDLVKTRLQIQQTQNKNDPKYYRGVADCFRKMYKQEGVFSFWKGIVPPILAETPKRAVKFFTFEQYKQFFMFGSPTPTPLTFSLAGLGAGITEAILVNPFEVVKVTLQSNKARSSELPSTWAVTRQIVAENGLGLRGFLPEYENQYKEFFRKVCIGFVSGILGSCINIPFDVAKSRIQGPQPVPGQIKYRSTLKSIGIVYKEEGFMALYKGLLPKVLRLGPGGAIMLVVYDYMHTFLTKKFE
ncbi:hypothetical protein JTB14_032297 [Gonioctena quinquepunctata]|nr:hypothetical protein JTB14_032297 [Gonioctena quinquepunctata]